MPHVLVGGPVPIQKRATVHELSRLLKKRRGGGEGDGMKLRGSCWDRSIGEMETGNEDRYDFFIVYTRSAQ